MPRASRQQSEATAARILAVARRRLAEQGAEALALEEVAAEAEVTRGAVYHHYGSRQGLVAAALAAAQAEVGAAVEAAATEAGDGWPGIEAGCLAFLRASAAPSVRRILLVDGPAIVGWEAWRALDAEHAQASLERGLAELAASGELADVAVAPAAALLSGAMNEAALRIGASDDVDAAVAATWPVLERMLAALRT